MKDLSAKIDPILEAMRAHSRFVLTTHVHPDGDGIGSELALHGLLQALGKEARILNPSPMPASYAFLDPDRHRVLAYQDHHERFVLQADVIFLLDIAETNRLGDLAGPVARSPAILVPIDHHETRAPSSGLALIDETASATAELVYALFKRAGPPLPAEIATALYVAVLTDTGCFRYANVTPAAHRLAAELLEAGADHQQTCLHLYESNSWRKTLLFARAIGGLQPACDGKVAWMKITRALLDETGASETDIEGLAEYPRSIGDVQIAILFVEQAPDRIRISFRSRNQTPVHRLAQRFGGGGHRNAAAAIVTGSSLDSTIDAVLHAAQEYLTA